MRGLMWRAATLVMLLLGTAGCADSLSGMSGAGDVKGTGRTVTVQPREIDEVLDNPVEVILQSVGDHHVVPGTLQPRTQLPQALTLARHPE